MFISRYLKLTFIIIISTRYLAFPQQILNDLKKSSEELVYTPFGSAKKSKVHYVNNNQALYLNGDSIVVLNTLNNKVDQTFCLDRSKSNSNAIQKQFDGWITYAYCSILDPSEFSTIYKVPSPPKENGSQLLYLFSGLGGGGGTWSRIIQPVLQWGVSPAGGGDYWAICNWYVSGNLEFFHDSLIQVNPGDKLEAVIKRISVENNTYSYVSYFEGYSDGLHIYNEGQLSTGYITFETYNVNRQEEYPIDEKIRFSDIMIESSASADEYHMEWISYDDLNSPKNKLGQYTRIIYNQYQHGLIEIHFHSPYSIDGFEEIHLYPNPVTDLLHISPGWIKNKLTIFPDKPISHCNIELFDLSGNLLQKKYIELFDFEIDLNISCFKSGIYIIRFSYDNRQHSFKVIKD